MPWYPFENDPDVIDYYREIDDATPWYMKTRRRGVIRPGMTGYRTMTVFGSVFIGVVGVIMILLGFVGRGEVLVFNIIMGIFLLIFSFVSPLWAFKKDDWVRAEIAQRKAQRLAFEQERYENLDSIGGIHQKAPLDNISDDNAWIPGQTHEPFGSPEEPEPIMSEKELVSKDEPELIETRTATSDDEIENERI